MSVKRLRDLLALDARLCGLCMLIAPRWTMDALGNAIIREYEEERQERSLAA